MAALKDSEYETFLPRLEAELKKYNETQCDKRNTYRRKVKADKDAAVEKEGGEGDTTETGDTSGAPPASSPHTNGASAPDAEGDAARPAKKLKGEHGTAITPGADDDMADDDGDDDEQEGNDQDEDDEDEAADDEVPDEDESEDDQPMEDALEEQEVDTSGIRDRDEALDDPDSD